MGIEDQSGRSADQAKESYLKDPERRLAYEMLLPFVHPWEDLELAALIYSRGLRIKGTDNIWLQGKTGYTMDQIKIGLQKEIELFGKGLNTLSADEAYKVINDMVSGK